MNLKYEKERFDKIGESEMKKKILAICMVSMFLLTSTSIVTAASPISDNNKGNGIRISVYIYPLLQTGGLRSLIAEVENKDVSHYLDGNFMIKMTYKGTELFFDRIEGGFYSSYGESGIISNISFSHPVIGTLFVDFTGSGKDYGLHESITLPVIIFKTKPYTWGHTPW